MSFRTVLSTLLIACSLPAHAGEEQWITYSGVATFRQSARLAYSERHTLHYRQGRLLERVVLYQCADGSAFARKTVSYLDPTAPDFLFEDASNGMREGVQSGAEGRVMLFRGNRRERERSSGLPGVSGLVIDAGFDEYIKGHWQSLLDAGAQPLPFLVPSRQEIINFHIEHLNRELIEGQDVELFRMKLDGVLGWVLPGIDVAYDAQEHWLVLYNGLSDLRDASGNNFQVQVMFKPSDRKTGDASIDAAMRAAPLAPCH